jgi:glycosyltransferase involved in cell wall biosynthesis
MTTSIIIPVYNEEKYLSKLLDSILRQTMKVDRIVICDNNSTDRSIEIARTFKKKLPILILSQKKKGVTPTVEKAWRSAKTDLILKVDADTVLPKNWVRNVVVHFEENIKLDAITGPWVPIKGNKIDLFFAFFGSSIGQSILIIIRGYPLLIGLNSAIRRKTLEKVDGYKNTDGQLDDQAITRKLKNISANMEFFTDCFVYHSVRRWHGNLMEYFKSFLSLFHPGFYKEKQI